MSISPPAYVKGVAGSVGGLVEALCLQPIDVIKTRLQLDTAKRYVGILDCGKQVWALRRHLFSFSLFLSLSLSLSRQR